ncbi:MAG TPA: hypothetical protein VF284_09690, partial [Rhodanobacteraceae bacterium]
RPWSIYGFMYLAVGMFPSCDMSSCGKLAPRNHGVNRFFAANEALALARTTMGAANGNLMADHARRLDVYSLRPWLFDVIAQTRVGIGFHARNAETVRCAKRRAR